MNDMTLDSVCRLCLTENFTHLNVFTNRSPCGEFVYEVLNFIYGLKICEGDGLPSKICLPCLWRMLEFHAYKKNVSYSELEIRKLLNRTISNSDEVSREQAYDNDVLGEDEIPMNNAGEAPEDFENEREISVKDEIDIVDWEMPKELQSKVDIEEEHCSERHLSLEEDINCIDNAVVKSEVVSPLMDLEVEEEECVLRNEKLEQLKSSETCEAITSECVRDRNASAEIIENGSSVVSNSVNKFKNEEVFQKDLSAAEMEEEESFDATILESSHNSSESGATRSVTPVERKKKDFVCDVCKKSFVSKYNLGRHVRVHYNERPFKCSKCGKAFKQYDVRRKHELLHLRMESGNASKPFSCDICAKQFKSQNGLIYHSNVHKNKYKCKYCGQGLGSNMQLNVHLRIHTNEKPFSCKVCKMSFTWKSSLKAHLATHSDDRPFQCNVCHKRFKSQNAKYQHELLHFRSNNY